MSNIVVKSIKNTLEKNGFPEKNIALPFRAIFDSCKKHEVKLSSVMKELQQEGIFNHIGEEKIIFSNSNKIPEGSTEKPASDYTQERTASPDMFQQAMEQMKNLDPAKFAELEERLKNMSPEERENLMNMAKGMMFNK